MKDFRRHLKSSLARTLHQLSLDTLFGSAFAAADAPLIICYHRVVEDFRDASTRAMPSLLVGTAMFERQLDWLARHYDMVSLDTLFTQPPRSARALQRRQASISFDDGYADFYWNAFPILKRKGIPSSVFVVTDLVGTPNLQIHDELYLLVSQCFTQPRTPVHDTDAPLTQHLEAALLLHTDPYAATRHLLALFSQQEVRDLVALLRERVTVSEQARLELQSLDWDMLRSLHEQGVTIGSHTRSHALLPHHGEHRVADELAGSRRQLGMQLGVPARYLAYPDGQFDERIAQAAEAAGYSGALTICTHVSPTRPRYTTSRRVLWENASIDASGAFSPAVMSCLVNGVFNRAARCAQDHDKT